MRKGREGIGEGKGGRGRWQMGGARREAMWRKEGQGDINAQIRLPGHEGMK